MKSTTVSEMRRSEGLRETPLQVPIRGFETVKEPIVADDEQFSGVVNRGKSNRAVGEEFAFPVCVS